MKHDNYRASYTVSHHCYRGFNFGEYKRFTVSAEKKDKIRFNPQFYICSQRSLLRLYMLCTDVVFSPKINFLLTSSG